MVPQSAHFLVRERREAIEGSISSSKAVCLGRRLIRGAVFGAYGGVPLPHRRLRQVKRLVG